jgi:hypothetical protein
MKLTLTLSLATLILIPAAGVAAGDELAAGDRLTAKGIYHDVDRYQRSGLKFRVVMDEGGRERLVPTTYPFRSGDRFTFSFEINRNTHVYVINRTQVSSVGATAAGYEPKRVDRSSRLGEPRLLFPTSRAGNDNRLASNRAHAVPTKGYFVMDEESGIEKLYVVIADRALDFGDFFDGDTGRLRGANPRTAALQARLDSWKDNSMVELVPKGIVHEVDGYGVTVDASRPAVVEIDLKHYR